MPVESIAQLGFALSGEPANPRAPAPVPRPLPATDLQEVRGQEAVKRALEVAAAGGHGLSLCGPLGAGKSLLISCLPALLDTTDVVLHVDLTRGYWIEALREAETAASMLLAIELHPCPCGHYGAALTPCSCPVQRVARYQRRAIAPLPRLVQMHIEVPPVRARDLADRRLGESSAAVRARVEGARRVQRTRAEREDALNARMTAREAAEWCQLGDGPEALIRTAVARLGMTARDHASVLRVARTIADLDGSDSIGTHHVSEAIQYRRLTVRAAA